MSKRSILLFLCLLLLGSASSAFAGLDPTLAAWWPFDEGEGNVAYDATGNGNDGVFEGDPQWVPGVLGSALEFDGDDYLNCGNGPTLQIQDAITMAIWFNVDAFSNTWEAFMAKGDNSYRASRGDGSGNATHMGISGTSTGGGNGYFNGTVIVTGGDWHHYASTYDGAEGRIYIDGVLDVVSEGTGQISISANDLYIGENSGATGRFLHGILDDIQIYNRALSETEINSIMSGLEDLALAQNPRPVDGATDIPRDVVLAWDAGETAATHDVYFGTVLDDVNNASRADPMGVLVSQGQTDATYDPDGLLEFGQTYYWRIDEVNAAPDNTIFKGKLWSFTAEPFAYAIPNVVATSNGASEPGVGPERTVDGSGLNDNDEHSTEAADMWLAVSGADPLQVQYDFDGLYKLHEMLVWNYNVIFEPMLGFGLKDVTVEYSADGENWTVLGDVTLAQATAKATYTANSAVPFNGAPVQHVRLTVNSGYGPMGQFGLSEVRFMFIPAQAREPQPADGDTNVLVGTTLSWRAGREAVTHDVYLGTDAADLVLADSVTEPSYTPGDLLFGGTYYWMIDEVNEADEVTAWASPIWTFDTQEFAVIDDFESYNDEDNRIFDTWLDGFINETGSTVGYFDAPFAEQTIVNSGGQSMPLEYANDAAPFYSEAEFDLGSMNLTGNGADTLRLYISGLAPAFAEAADGAILMNAIGADIWANADQFRYAYKSLTGDGSMVARVDALDATPSTWAKAGVMVRQNDAVGSVHSFMCMTGGDGNGASWQGRTSENGTSVNNDATSAVAPPYWVRIDRSGDTLTGYLSPDGQDWTQLGDARSISMTDPVLIGLALTSHNAAMATSAEFSNVSFTGSVSGSWQVAEIGVAQPEGNDPEAVYVALEDASGGVAVVTHPDARITARSGWTEWLIPYSDLAGVNLSRLATMIIGVGDRDNPTAGGTGTIFVDDIGYGKPASIE